MLVSLLELSIGSNSTRNSVVVLLRPVDFPSDGQTRVWGSKGPRKSHEKNPGSLTFHWSSWLFKFSGLQKFRLWNHPRTGQNFIPNKSPIRASFWTFGFRCLQSHHLRCRSRSLRNFQGQGRPGTSDGSPGFSRDCRGFLDYRGNFHPVGGNTSADCRCILVGKLCRNFTPRDQGLQLNMPRCRHHEASMVHQKHHRLSFIVNSDLIDFHRSWNGWKGMVLLSEMDLKVTKLWLRHGQKQGLNMEWNVNHSTNQNSKSIISFSEIHLRPLCISGTVGLKTSRSKAWKGQADRMWIPFTSRKELHNSSSFHFCQLCEPFPCRLENIRKQQQQQSSWLATKTNQLIREEKSCRGGCHLFPGMSLRWVLPHLPRWSVSWHRRGHPWPQHQAPLLQLVLSGKYFAMKRWFRTIKKSAKNLEPDNPTKWYFLI